LLKSQGIHPVAIVTHKLGSYGAAAKAVGVSDRHEPGRLPQSNRAENAHLPIRLFRPHKNWPLIQRRGLTLAAGGPRSNTETAKGRARAGRDPHHPV
jgi:putative transposase